MEYIFEILLSQSNWISWRGLIRLVLLSGLFALVCLLAFPRNAPSRRVLLMASVAALTVLPMMLAGGWSIWLLPVDALPSFTLSQGLPVIALLVWGFVAGLLIAHFVYQVSVKISSFHRLPPLHDKRTELNANTIVQQLSHRLGIAEPRLYVGACASSSTVWRRGICLPVDYTEWDSQTLRSVLAHELVHIARRDDRWLLTFQLVVLLYWWMPWIRSMYSQFLRCVEESCDDAACEMVGHDLTYVEALAGVATRQHQAGRAGNNKSTQPVTAMHEHHLLGRIGRFTQLRQIEVETRGLYWCIVGILAGVIVLSGLEPTQRPPTSADHGYSYKSVPVLASEHLPGAPSAVYPQTRQYNTYARTLSEHERARLNEPTYLPAVIYPGDAIRDGVEGDVEVIFYVGADGSISNPHVVASQPANIFDDAALRAVMNTKYAARYPTLQPGFAGGAVVQPKQINTQHIGRSLSTVEVHRHFKFRLERR